MLKAWLYRTSLKKRIWLTFTALTVFCISITGLFAYSIASRAMERNSVELNQNVLNQSVNVLDQKLKQIIVASSTMMLSETYRQTIRDIQAHNTERFFANFSLLQGPFTQAELTENSIEAILLSTPDGDFYSAGNLRRTATPFMETSLYQRIRENPQSNWVESHVDELFDGSHQVISLLLQPLTENYVPDVFLTVNVKEDILEDTISGGASLGSARFLLINKSGASVFGDAQRPDWTRTASFMDRLQEGGRGNFEYAAGDSPMLVSYAESRYAGDWVLVSYLSKKELLQPVRSIQWLVLMIMAVCILLALLLARYLSALLLGPLLKLQKTMSRVEQEDLAARFQSPFQDEIGDAGRKFNQMLDRIGGLIAEVKDTEQEKRKAEIKALQAQIEPHFLYNTLNTIFWKCEMDEYDDVKEMVISLSALFRLGLNNGEEITTLGRELEHVRQYLNLQQQCYEGLFDYTISAGQELLELPVLKIIIQPLVENSILHGLKELHGGGIIRIAVEKEEDRLLIRVTDNGAGMDAEALNARMKEPGASGGYALANISSRLQLYYGKAAELTFSSRPHIETEAVLTIPMEGGVHSEQR
ncbi:sensor histidine kinase [Paenibacillus sp. PK3_47]|uniref:sensor histidine kinase n=1 Tax=Paenibacillus sp. PK3_47 TaxID=2072642 RepID=UPI00201E6AAE|nr:sensor histidine kinase [Paenibacillus sp. PK3_47]UQZ34012.1 sensor histidine kinase [Paenibacillus sp. PK3_47]